MSLVQSLINHIPPRQTRVVRSGHPTRIGLPAARRASPNPLAFAANNASLKRVRNAAVALFFVIPLEKGSRALNCLPATAVSFSTSVIVSGASSPRCVTIAARSVADAQRVFDKYAGGLLIHFERNLAHAKALHEYNSDMQVYIDQVAVNMDFEGRAAAMDTLVGRYRALRKGHQRFVDEEKLIAKHQLKAKNTALLARALQPS